MKYILFLLTLLFTLPAEASPCRDQFMKANDWSALPAAQAACLRAHPDFIKALAQFCTKDYKALAPVYRKFLSLQATHNQACAFAAREPEGANKTVLLQECQNAEYAVNVFDVNYQISELLWPASVAAYNCDAK